MQRLAAFPVLVLPLLEPESGKDNATPSMSSLDKDKSSLTSLGGSIIYKIITMIFKPDKNQESYLLNFLLGCVTIFFDVSGLVILQMSTAEVRCHSEDEIQSMDPEVEDSHSFMKIKLLVQGT